MEFENEFTVPVPPTQAWDALMDMDRVAHCMPGATLLDNDGERFVGRVKVKVGPITVSYKGAAEFVEKDETAKRAVLTAKGREERGAGNAGMRVTARLEPVGTGETKVLVQTDLDITGKPAQFGRGVMAEVGTSIIEQFATRLAAQLGSDQETDPALSSGESTEAIRDGDRSSDTAPGRSAPNSPTRTQPDHDDTLNLGLAAWAPVARRATPVLAGAAGVLLLSLLFKRRSGPSIVVVYPSPPAG